MLYSTKKAGLPFKAATALPATVESILGDCFTAKGRKSGSWGKQRQQEGQKRWCGTDGMRRCDFCLIFAKGKGAAAWYLLLTYMRFVKFQQNAMTTMRRKESKKWELLQTWLVIFLRMTPAALHQSQGNASLKSSVIYAFLLLPSPCFSPKRLLIYSWQWLRLCSPPFTPLSAFDVLHHPAFFYRWKPQCAWQKGRWDEMIHSSIPGCGTQIPDDPLPDRLAPSERSILRPVQVQEQHLLGGRSSSSLPIVTGRDGGKEASLQLWKRVCGAVLFVCRAW